MVQKEGASSGDESTTNTTSTGTPAPFVNPAKGVPVGKYHLVGWAIDTTGPRLIDEICQIATYTLKSQFSQYIMPFTDFNRSFSRRQNIRIVNTPKYRRLKDERTNQFVKTKSEISALTDFLQWLEDIKGNSDGVILIYHEVRKTAPGILLEALRRYQLVERFENTVKGFANGFHIAQAKCSNATKSFSLRVLSKILLNDEKGEIDTAVQRAKAVYDITVHLAQGEREDLDAKASGDCTGVEPHIIEFVCPFANPISVEEEEVAGFKVLLERQNTFRPVFGALMKASITERRHATHLRRLLAENNINYDTLKNAFAEGGKDALEKVIKTEVSNANEKDMEELLEILDCYFDPEKKPIRPKRFAPNNNRRNRKKSFNSKKRQISESATSSPNASSDSHDVQGDSPRSAGGDNQQQHEQQETNKQEVAAAQ